MRCFFTPSAVPCLCALAHPVPEGYCGPPECLVVQIFAPFAVG
jgi:hypothetical protein